MLYEAEIKSQLINYIAIHQLKDYANVYLNRIYRKSLYCRKNQNSVFFFSKPGEHMKLDILVENMGRMNFGHPLFDR